jgi:hypothetical protein
MCMRSPNGCAAATLDFTQPIALVLLGVMGHITDTDEAQGIVQRLVDGLPSGSYLALADSINTNADFNAAQQGYDDTGAVPYQLRSAAEIGRFKVDEVCGVARIS